jgi:putative DNA primase/helicase
MSSIATETIPEELRQRPQWVVWKLEKRNGYDTKVPYIAGGMGKASSTDLATWRPYEKAVRALETGRYDGLGFVLSSGDGYGGVDLDNCRDPETGELEEWAAKTVEDLDGYTEVSPSGRGVHIFVRGKAPNRKRGKVEAYSSERFFTVTGEVLGEPPARIPERQAQLDALVAKYLRERASGPETNGWHTNGDASQGALLMSDDTIIERCRRARNGAKFERLFDRGDTSEYGGDSSRADSALASLMAFYTDDPGQLDRLFRQSALMRSKWDERRGARTYGRRTIEHVLANRTESYTPPREGPAGGQAPLSTNGRTDNCPPDRFNLTDLGNALRLVDRHGEDLRYVHAWDRWLVWTGSRWEQDRTGEVERRAKETVRSIYAEASSTEDPQDGKALGDHATRSAAKGRIEAMIALARSEPGIPAVPEQLDADPWLLNVRNGTVDLRTGELQPHRREDLITKIAPVQYAPGAAAPTWEAFLERVLPGEELRRFVRRVIGYALTGDVSEQVLIFLHGAGANGKSTLINAVLAMLGDYGQQAAPELLTVKGASHPTELADLLGTRFAASVEVEDGRRLAESLVKQLTGGDRIKARFMRQDFFEFDPTHKVFLAANHKPTIRGTDHAIWRRIKLVPFDVTIPKAEQDPRLFEKLQAELSGILAWAIRGCLEWCRDGLGEPEEVRAATEGYRAEMDVLAAFIEERCVEYPDATATAKALWDAYKGWTGESGEDHGTQRRFGMRLTERGFERRRITSGERKGTYEWVGIGLIYPGEPPDGPQTPEDGEPSEHKGSPQKALQNAASLPDAPKAVNDGEPIFGINGSKNAREEVIAKKGSLGSLGSPEDPGDVPPELVAYLKAPPGWLVTQAGEVRRDPAKLKPTCSSIAYELYGYSGRGEEIKDAVAEWIAGGGGVA